MSVGSPWDDETETTSPDEVTMRDIYKYYICKLGPDITKEDLEAEFTDDTLTLERMTALENNVRIYRKLGLLDSPQKKNV